MANKNRKTFIGFFFDLEKEEKWVNSICKKGWKLERIILGMFFVFSKCQADEYEVKYYFTNLKDLNARREFVKEWGYEIIPHSSDLTPWLMYLVRRKSEDNAEIASDISSQLEDYRRRNKMFTILGILFIFLALVFLLETSVFINDLICSYELDAFEIFMTVFTGVFFILMIFSSAVCFNIRRKIKAKIKRLEKDKAIYQ